MGDEGKSTCPDDGCPAVKQAVSEMTHVYELLSSGTKRDLEALADKMTATVLQAKECLDDFSDSHKTLNATMAELNLTIHMQSVEMKSGKEAIEARLKEGTKKFESLESEIKELDSNQDTLTTKLAVLEDHDKHRGNPLTKKTVGAIGAGSGTVTAIVIEFVKGFFASQ